MTMYLVRKSGNGKAHYWDGKDTKCRMASTGGLSMRRYQVAVDPGGRPICHMCMMSSNETQQPAAASTNVTPLRPNVRYYCSDCDEHYHEHERARHENCCPQTFCTGCGFARSDGDGDCPRCGAPHPAPTIDEQPS